MTNTLAPTHASTPPPAHAAPSAPPAFTPTVVPGAASPGHIPREMAIPGMHALAMPVLLREVPPTRPDGAPAVALDLGAGSGALCVKLLSAGYDTLACDMFPEMFACPGVECRKVDVHGTLPYADASIDLVAAFELVEHLESHRALFNEAARVLRPGGRFIFTTPNIMSLKSRLRFLLTGCFYSHAPLDPRVVNPVQQHIAAFTPDRYRWLLAQSGLDLTRVACDKFGNSSLALAGLWPFIKLACLRGFGKHVTDPTGGHMQNTPAALFGRTMIAIARKR